MHEAAGKVAKALYTLMPVGLELHRIIWWYI